MIPYKSIARPYILFIIIGLSMLLTGCLFKPAPPTLEVQTEKIQGFVKTGGYETSKLYEINSKTEVWLHDRNRLEVSITVPTEPGTYPLIVYLPGLGENALAGRLWRENWAKAGYAVFSLQPVQIAEALKELLPQRGDKGDAQTRPDKNEWFGLLDKDKPLPSKDLKNSELHYIGHQYFSQEALKRRMEHLFWAYEQLKQRVQDKQAPFAAADLSRVTLAGYDLGAQTVQAVIGENYEATLPSSKGFKPNAAILISPSVNLASGNLQTRYQKLNIPMLVITGSEDDDPYAISSAPIRTAVWEYAPTDNKYLLLLNEARHSLLAGSDFTHSQGMAQDEANETAQEETEAAMPHLTDSYRSGGMRGSRGSEPSDRMPWAAKKDGERRYKQIAAIYSTSTAFLDSLIKTNEFARFWLTNKANKWLDKAASLRIK